MKAVFSIDAKLINHLKSIFTPILDINQCVMDVFKTSKILREINTFEREDGTPLHYTLINIKDWCKNTFEGVNQLRQSRSQTIRILP
jgi:type I site-specific restriction-modification system R (restriction) subunit